MGAFIGFLGGLVGAAKSYVVSLFQQLAAGVGSAADALFDEIGNLITGAVGDLATLAGNIFQDVKGAWNSLEPSLSGFLQSTMNALNSAAAFAEHIADVVLPDIRNFIQDGLNAAASALADLINYVTNAFAQAYDYIAQTAQTIFDWVNSQVLLPLESLIESVSQNVQTIWGIVDTLLNHPQNLADLLVHYLVISFENALDDLIVPVGIWVGKAFLARIPQLANIIEEIVAGVF